MKATNTRVPILQIYNLPRSIDVNRWLFLSKSYSNRSFYGKRTPLYQSVHCPVIIHRRFFTVVEPVPILVVL